MLHQGWMVLVQHGSVWQCLDVAMTRPHNDAAAAAATVKAKNSRNSNNGRRASRRFNSRSRASMNNDILHRESRRLCSPKREGRSNHHWKYIWPRVEQNEGTVQTKSFSAQRSGPGEANFHRCEIELTKSLKTSVASKIKLSFLRYRNCPI